MTWERRTYQQFVPEVSEGTTRPFRCTKIGADLTLAKVYQGMNLPHEAPDADELDEGRTHWRKGLHSLGNATGSYLWALVPAKGDLPSSSKLGWPPWPF
jgi:hypothetical protein